LKNLSVSIDHWTALKAVLAPATPFRKKPIRKLLDAIEADGQAGICQRGYPGAGSFIEWAA